MRKFKTNERVTPSPLKKFKPLRNRWFILIVFARSKIKSCLKQKKYFMVAGRGSSYMNSENLY